MSTLKLDENEIATAVICREGKSKTKDENKGVHLELNVLRPLGRRLVDYSMDRYLSFAIVNTQSICNKDDECIQDITGSKLHICCVTAAW